MVAVGQVEKRGGIGPALDHLQALHPSGFCLFRTHQHIAVAIAGVGQCVAHRPCVGMPELLRATRDGVAQVVEVTGRVVTGLEPQARRAASVDRRIEQLVQPSLGVVGPADPIRLPVHDLLHTLRSPEAVVGELGADVVRTRLRNRACLCRSARYPTAAWSYRRSSSGSAFGQGHQCSNASVSPDSRWRLSTISSWPL